MVKGIKTAEETARKYYSFLVENYGEDIAEAVFIRLHERARMTDKQLKEADAVEKDIAKGITKTIAKVLWEA